MTVLVPKVAAPVPVLAASDRDWLRQMLSRMASASALRDDGHKRYAGESTINVAEHGTFGYIPAKGFTFTDTGSIFIREEVLVGMLADHYTASQVLGMLVRGDVVDPTRWPNPDVVREVVAAYGVTGHELGHLAGSEHAGRAAWQMVLEDLRIESLWLDADPIRARQALRACAEHWVANDKSPTASGGATIVIDPDQYRTKADVLHAYLLFVGRARIGVLQDESLLVDGVRRVASQVLGYDLLVEADELIDRYLETARDHEDLGGIRERFALAKRMAALVKDEPRVKGGCFHGPKSDAEPGEGEPGEGESGEGEGQEGEGSDSDDSDSEDGEGEGEGQEGEGQEGEGEGEGSDGEGSDDSEDGEGEGQGEGEGDSDGEGGEGSDDTDSDGEGDSDGGDSEGGTPGDAEGGKPGGDSGKGERTGGEGAGFESLAEGAQVKGKVRPTDDGYKGEAAEAATEHGGHERIDNDTAKALAEALQQGLTEVNDPTADAGWAISEEEAMGFAVDRVPAKRVSQEVFNPRSKATRNRRIR